MKEDNQICFAIGPIGRYEPSSRTTKEPHILELKLNPNQPKRRPTNEGTRSLTKCLSKLAF